MHSETTVLLMIVAAVGFGLLAQVLSHRWQIPAIVFLLGLGIILGKDVLGIIQPDMFDGGMGILIKLSVAIILFEGALNLNLKWLQQCAVEIRRLVTIGVLLSWGLTTLLTHFVAGFEWRIALLFGALMTVTGPTVVQPILRRISAPRSVKMVLEAEAILVDPIGAVLAIAVLDVILANASQGGTTFLSILWVYFGRILIGGAVGALGAFVLAFLLKNRRWIPSELSNLVALTLVWVTFAVAESLQSEAGIMAAVAMGLITQRQNVPGVQRLRRFKELLSILGISVVFILLAANLDLVTIWHEGLTGLLTVLLIMFVVRPVAVFVSTWRTKLTWQQKALIAWIGPRGIIAASMASIFALALGESGIAGGERLLALTFLTILLTVIVQGLTARPLTRLLGLQDMQGKKVLIVGINRLSYTVAQLFKENGRPVLLVDINRTSVEQARNNGFEAVYGNALEENLLEELHVEEYDTFLALTSNSEVNVLACQLAHEVFGIERAFPALSDPAKGVNLKLLDQIGGRQVFSRFIDVRDWEQPEMEIHRIVWVVPETSPLLRAVDANTSCEILPILRIRRESAEVVYGEQMWQAGDKIVLISLLQENMVFKELGQESPCD